MGKHLEFDTDFLNNVKPTAPKSNNSGTPNWVYGGRDQETTTTKPYRSSSTKKSHKLRYSLIGVGLFIGLMVWLSTLPSTTTPSTTTRTPSGGNLVQNGKYWCSYSDSSQANSLGPTAAEKSSIDAEEAAINTTKNELDNEYVDETNRFAVSSYNSRVAAYNARLAAYKVKIGPYNAKVGAYNNYLRDHCSTSQN